MSGHTQSLHPATDSLKDYPCPMPTVFLTPFVIAGLLFLPSCSSAEEKLCEKAKLGIQEFSDDAKKYAAKSQPIYQTREALIEAKNNSIWMWESAIKSQKIIVNNPNCFTPKEVVNAESLINEIRTEFLDKLK